MLVCFTDQYQLWPPREWRPQLGAFWIDDVLWVLIGPTQVSETEPADWTFPLTWDLGWWGHVSSSAWAWVAPGSAYLHLSQAEGSPSPLHPPDPHWTNYLTYPPTQIFLCLLPKPAPWGKQRHLQIKCKLTINKSLYQKAVSLLTPIIWSLLLRGLSD